jgi:hypothetical protein
MTARGMARITRGWATSPREAHWLDFLTEPPIAASEARSASSIMFRAVAPVIPARVQSVRREKLTGSIS